MLLLSNDEVIQKYMGVIYALALSKVKRDGPATVICSETLRQYETRNKRVAFADEKTLGLFLRKTAERLCENYLKRNINERNRSHVAGVPAGRNPYNQDGF